MNEQLIDQKTWRNIDPKIPVCFMFLYNYFRILGFSNLKETLDINILVTISLYGLMISLIPSLLAGRYRWNLLFMAIAILGVLVSNYDGVTNYATIIFTVVALANHDIKPYVKAIFFSLILGGLSVLFLRFVGFIPDRIAVSPRGVTRYTFGFGSARGLSEMYLTFCQLFVFLNFDKLKKWWLFILFIPMLLINLVTDARATTLLGIIFLVMVYFVMTREKSNKLAIILYRLANIALCFSAFAIFLGSYFYKYTPLWLQLDNFVSNRFQFGHWFLSNFPVKLFGQWIPVGVDKNTLLTQYNTNYLMLDSGYMTMLVEGGIVVTIIMLTIILISFKKMKDKRNYVGLLIWIVSALNLFQTRLLNPATLEILLLAQVFELVTTRKKLNIKNSSILKNEISK